MTYTEKHIHLTDKFALIPADISGLYQDENTVVQLPDCDALSSWTPSLFSAPGGWFSPLGFCDSVHSVVFGSEPVLSHLFSLSTRILATKRSLLCRPARWRWSEPQHLGSCLELCCCEGWRVRLLRWQNFTELILNVNVGHAHACFC